MRFLTHLVSNPIDSQRRFLKQIAHESLASCAPCGFMDARSTIHSSLACSQRLVCTLIVITNASPSADAHAMSPKQKYLRSLIVGEELRRGG